MTSNNPIGNTIQLKEWDAESLKQLRKKCGLTQVDVATFLGITQNAIGAIEQGRTTTYSIVQFYGLILSIYANEKGLLPEGLDTPITVKHRYSSSSSGTAVKWS